MTLMEAVAVTVVQFLRQRMPVAGTWGGHTGLLGRTHVHFWESVFKAFMSSRQHNCTELSRAFPKVFLENLQGGTNVILLK